jgi:hypothetical protein
LDNLPLPSEPWVDDAWRKLRAHWLRATQADSQSIGGNFGVASASTLDSLLRNCGDQNLENFVSAAARALGSIAVDPQGVRDFSAAFLSAVDILTGAATARGLVPPKIKVPGLPRTFLAILGEGRNQPAILRHVRTDASPGELATAIVDTWQSSNDVEGLFTIIRMLIETGVPVLWDDVIGTAIEQLQKPLDREHEGAVEILGALWMHEPSAKQYFTNAIVFSDIRALLSMALQNRPALAARLTALLILAMDQTSVPKIATNVLAMRRREDLIPLIKEALERYAPGVNLPPIDLDANPQLGMFVNSLR